MRKLKETNKKVIKMTRKGFEELIKELNSKKDERDSLKKAKAIIIKNTPEIDYDENCGLHEVERQISLANSAIKDLNELIKNVIIIEELEMDSDSINIGDTIDANFTFAPDDEEEMRIKLVGGQARTLHDEVSIASPVGKAIYGRKIGETVYYDANNKSKNNVKVRILRKVPNQNQE